MVDTNALGVTGSVFEMDIERGKVREFARATFSVNPSYLEGPNPISEPTFLTTAMFWHDQSSDPWPAVAMDQRRGLHAEQEFVFFGPPPRAGTRLSGQARIEQIYEKQGRRGGLMTFVVMVTDFHDEHGQLVARATLTGVETERPPDGGP
jgi:hypothetical protein